MKRSFLCLVTGLLLQNLQAQYNGYMQELVFIKQPSARVEALGTSYVAIGGDVYSSYYNPAGISLLNGLEFEAGNSSSHFFYENTNYTFAGLGSKVSKWLTMSGSVYNYDMGESIMGKSSEDSSDINYRQMFIN